MVSFNSSRPDFAPYGFTCQRWTPVPMKRPDRHNEIELNLLRQGSLTYLFGGNSVTIEAGRLAVFWAAIPHQIIGSSDNAEYFVATIPLVWFLQFPFPEHFLHAILHAQVVLDPQSDGVRNDLELFAQWVHDFRSPLPARKRIILLEMEARLLRVALTLPRSKSTFRRVKKPRLLLGTGALTRVEQVACFIAQHYTEPLTAEQIAKSTGLHPNYTMGLFKKTFGMTLIDCVTQHRVSHAQRLLAITTEKIVDVALASGFNTISRFNEAFKKSCGCSPREYRDKHRP